MSNTKPIIQTVRSRFASGKQAFIYNELVRFYNRSRRKLHHLVVEGRNLRKQNILQKRIARLFKTLTGMQQSLKLGMTTAALSAGVLLFQHNAAQAQIITFQNEGNGTNPFGLTEYWWTPAPAFVDLDADGDMDIMAGEWFGSLLYYENTGTSAAPAYAPVQGNPFGLTPIGDNYTPSFVDLDGDGDMDMMAGEQHGDFFYFQNTGTATAPTFAAPQTNPFGLTNIGSYSAPAFADLDGDGDMDLIAGEDNGNFFYFQNMGTASTPAFAEAQTNPFDLTDIGSISHPTFADLDGDGDMDMIAGEYYGGYYYFQNKGTPYIPAFDTVENNPFGLFSFTWNSSPAFGDLNGDGDLDMIAGESYVDIFCEGCSYFHYLKNTGTALAPVFINPQINPFALPDIGTYSTPAFADLDADGDMDLMAGERSGNFFYFQNTGNGSNAVFTSSQTNPFALLDIGMESSPAFVDLDGDGDMDILAGEYGGSFFYFQNIGSAAAPSFAASQTNPFGLANIDVWSKPTFADLDADGDMDLMAGERSGDFMYFQNIGTPANPSFASAEINSFGLMNTDLWNAPAFADLDADGDLDMLAGEFYGGFVFFQNSGTVTAPAFTLINPFSLPFLSTYLTHPAFVDLDGDGDMDIVAGDEYGIFYYFENTTSCYGLTAFADADGDSYGDLATSLFVADCIVPGGYVENSDDCNDAYASINPAATEVLNGYDDNCNGIIDDIACIIPANLSATKITGTSAKLTWDAVAGVARYVVRYKASNASEWKNESTNNNSKKISGLLPNTVYTWLVRTICQTDPKILSDWSAKQTFTTGSLRLGEEQEISFDLYPNPVSENFTIDLQLNSGADQSADIFLLNSLGQIVYSEKVITGNGELKTEITMPSSASSGWYIVRVVLSDQVIEKKLLYQK